MSDVFIQNTPDGGEMTVGDGSVAMINDMRTSVYLSLTTPKAWLNLLEEHPFTGNFVQLLTGIPMTTGNIARLENAAKQDLEWLKTAGYATEITVSSRIEGARRIYLSVDLDGVLYEYPFEWGA